MFMVLYLGLALLIGVVVAVVVTRANHRSRTGKSGVAAATKQQVGVGQPAAKRSPGAD